ncbi:MAG: legume-like lectin family-domain-containing protein [Linnemannia elongata]|nr:MAG: legume-like lectin family-domain-containing protein [Linnemannia elongata]
MRTTTFLLPVVFLSSALAWGRDGGNGSGSTKSSINNYNQEFVLPAENRRYDYKQSLKKPFTYNGAMPFWGNHGNSFVASDFVRLSPSVPGLKGSVWRQAPNEYKEWEVEFQFKAFGQGQVGGKGLAFWYTQERAIDGNVFGSKDQWKGLGVFLDTADPANQRNNPVIYGIMNDGTKPFPANPTANTNSFGGCLRDYKNTHLPVVVRVSYINGVLKVSTDTHSRGKKMIPCFEQKDLDLPVGYHFGLSAQAADHGNPDDHDLYAFEVYEVNPPKKEKAPLRPHEAEMKKKGEEVKVDLADQATFEEVQKIVEEQEAKIKEETEGTGNLSPAQVAATVGDTQYRIIESLNSIHNKLETLGAPMQPPESSAKSLEDINHKINSMAASLHAMESVVQGLVDHIMAQGGIASGPDISKVLKEELSNLNAKMEDMDSRQSFQHRLTQNRLVNSTSWVSYVVFLILVQVVAVSAYTWYKKRLEMNEKKFL